LVLAQLGGQPFERRQRAPLDPVHLALPAIEFAVEEILADAEDRRQTGRLDVDPVDRDKLVDQALAHVPNLLGLVDLAGHGQLVHRAGQALHDQKRPAQHVSGRFHEQRARRLDGCVRQAPQDVELPLQIIGFEQAGFRRTHPQHDVLAVLTVRAAPHQREQHHLGRVPEVDGVEPFDVYIAGLWQLSGEPGGEGVAQAAYLSAARTQTTQA